MPTWRDVIPAIRALCLASCFLAVSIAVPGQDISLQDMARAAWRPDAELTCVQFIDSKLGWAVGEHGAIWSTTDGGLTWTDSAHSVPLAFATTRWETVHFIDARNGWVAGGFAYPYTDLSRGVILETRDGGNSWQTLGLARLPQVFQIALDCNLGGVAAGRSNPLYKTGFYVTGDGGRQWTSDDTRDWIDLRAAATTDRGWIGVSSNGELVSRIVGRSEAVVYRDPSDAPFQCVAMVDGLRGWAAGQRGLIAHTTDGGLTWEIPQGWREHQARMSGVHFSSLTFANEHLWLVGDPGDVIWRYDPATGALHQHLPGTSLALNHIHFMDARHGWVVGQKGQIARTSDGGNAWELIRGGGSDITVLTVAFDSGDLAYEALTRLATEDGFLSACLCLHWSSHAVDPAKLRQAASRLGATAVWTRQLSPPTDNSDARWQRELVEHLARTIRRLRPRVVVCNQRLICSKQDTWLDTKTILEEAIRCAAQREPIDPLLQLASDVAWQVDRLAVRDSNAVNPWVLYGDQTMPRVGETVGDHAALSRALAGLPLWSREPLHYYVQRLTAVGFDQSHLLGGLAESGRKLPRREREQIQRGNLNMLKQVQNKDQYKKQLLSWTQRETPDIVLWTAQILNWTSATDYHCAGIWLAELAQDCLETGRLELAAAAFNALTDRYPDHPLAPAAHRWLVQLAASSETHVAREPAIPRLLPGALPPLAASDPAADRQIPAAQDLNRSSAEVIQVAWQSDARREDSGAVAADQSSPLSPTDWDSRLINQRVAQQTAWQLNRLRTHFPDLAAADDIRLCDAHVTRLTKGWSVARPLYQSIAANRTALTENEVSPARRAARQSALTAQCELDLQAGKSAALPMITARRANTRPLLDGCLDDELWSHLLSGGGAQFLRNASPVPGAAPRTDLLLWAYDDEFLFIAARCHKIAAQANRATTEPRPRDADLLRQDRIELSFDLDRDGTWPLTLIVDARGWTRDQCGEYKTWDPQWFVAAASDESSWTIEVAIPWTQFGAGVPTVDDQWGIGCCRRVLDDHNVWDFPDGGRRTWDAQRCALMPRESAGRWGRLQFE